MKIKGTVFPSIKKRMKTSLIEDIKWGGEQRGGERWPVVSPASSTHEEEGIVAPRRRDGEIDLRQHKHMDPGYSSQPLFVLISFPLLDCHNTIKEVRYGWQGERD